VAKRSGPAVPEEVLAVMDDVDGTDGALEAEKASPVGPGS
jgi:hypothetical protein